MLFRSVWLANDPQVKGESVRDTLIDLLNYVLYAIFLLEEGNIRGPQE